MKREKKTKIALNRETVRLLDSSSLTKAAGGITTTCPPTVSCCTCRKTCDSCIPCPSGGV